MSSSKELSAAIKKLKVLNFSPKMEIKDFREKFEKTFCSVHIPNRVESCEKDINGVSCVELIPDVYSSQRVLLYIHGGAFVAGSAKSYTPFAATLANATSARTIIPNFKLPPSHPYPAGLDDVREVFRQLYTEVSVTLSMQAQSFASNDKKPEIIIAADDSGASIAMALLFDLRGRYRDCIKYLMLFSPILNISDSNPFFTEKKHKDDVYSNECLKRCAELYTYAENRSKPFISPVYVTETFLDNFPPVFIQVGSKDYMVDDAICLKSILSEKNVECDLDIVENMPHLFQLDDENLSEAHLAIEKAGNLITRRKVSKSDSVFTASLVVEKSNFIPSEETIQNGEENIDYSSYSNSSTENTQWN